MDNDKLLGSTNSQMGAMDDKDHLGSDFVKLLELSNSAYVLSPTGVMKKDLGWFGESFDRVPLGAQKVNTVDEFH